jgi:hypothetical protein
MTPMTDTTASQSERAQPAPADVVEKRFWLVLQEPRRVPERKGPWPYSQVTKVLREFMDARPTAYIHVLTLDCAGEPWVDHGPEVLQIMDGRSMNTGRKHNGRVAEAHGLTAMGVSGEVAEDDWLVRQLEAWPTRVDPEKTTNIEYLMKAAAGRIRQALNSAPETR